MADYFSSYNTDYDSWIERKKMYKEMYQSVLNSNSSVQRVEPEQTREERKKILSRKIDELTEKCEEIFEIVEFVPDYSTVKADLVKLHENYVTNRDKCMADLEKLEKPVETFKCVRCGKVHEKKIYRQELCSTCAEYRAKEKTKMNSGSSWFDDWM